MLDKVLAKTNTEIRINVSASESAQKKLLNKFGNGIISCGILAVVFMVAWLGGEIFLALAPYQRAFLGIYLTVATIWYLFLYCKLRSINVSQLAPVKLYAEATRLKIYTLYGEGVACIGLAVFFSLFMPDLWRASQFAFWCCLIVVVFGFVKTVLYLLPKYTKLFNALNTIED